LRVGQNEEVLRALPLANFAAPYQANDIQEEANFQFKIESVVDLASLPKQTQFVSLLLIGCAPRPP